MTELLLGLTVLLGMRLIFFRRFVRARNRAEQALRAEVRKRQQVEEALRQSEEQFRGAFEGAAIGKALVAPDGRWLRVNRALCAIVGYDEKELLATTFQAITHPDDLDADLDYVRQMLAGALRHYSMEKRYFHKDGHIVWILLSASLVHDEQGAPLYFIGQVQDITPRKRVEQERETLIAQLRDALATVKTLRGLMPICAWCKQIRNDQGYWQQLETHLREHLDVDFTHGICPDCAAALTEEAEHVAAADGALAAVP